MTTIVVAKNRATENAASVAKEKLFDHYLSLLNSELVPAMGCTEPIAIAYASALCAHTLGRKPGHIAIACSPNIIKNVKSVIVPNSDGMKGIAAAAAVGAFGGDHARKLEVLAGVSAEACREARAFVENGGCEVGVLRSDSILHLLVGMTADGESASVELADTHTNIVAIVKNGESVFELPRGPARTDGDDAEPVAMTVDSILEFARTVPIERVAETLERQIELNTAISREGMANPWGAGIGRILARRGDDVATRAKAAAAAASDARMSGCDRAVVINSGSGNQGATASLPVIEYARELGASREELLRALAVSNLVALYQKSFIGKLSAYCGVVSAASGSGAAITFLKGGDDRQVRDTVTNTLAITSGMVCDGAKASCAAKIAVAVESAVMGHHMAMDGVRFQAGDGIVKRDADETIQAVGRLASRGMRQTDQEILDIMLES